MRTPLAGWRVSVRRTRADWPIVAAAGLITLLAAVLLAAGPTYQSAVSVAGLRQTLNDAPVADANVQVTLRLEPDEAARVDAAVRPELAAVAGPLGAEVPRFVRSDSFALPDQQDETPDLTFFEFRDGLDAHTTLVEGSWPQDGAQAEQAIEVALMDVAAQAMALEVGDEVALTSRIDEAFAVRAVVVGLLAVDDPSDGYWWADQQLLTGEGGENYRVLGPMLAGANDVLRRTTVTAVNFGWRLFPDYGGLTVDDAPALQARLEALPVRMEIASGGRSPRIDTGLDEILADAERSLLVARTGVLLLMAQLAILAAYAIVLTAALLVDHRRIDTAMLRSRGAGSWQVARLAAAEGLLLAVPAVLVAPWLAVGAVWLLNIFGPLADVGLEIEPAVSGDAYLAAAAAGIGAVVLLVIPALIAARGFAAEQGGLSRAETRTLGQRLGLDIALVAITAIGFWQLRLYGGPLTRTVHGSLGLDPLLIAAPAIGLLAGGVLALRMLPLLAQAVESLLARGRDLVGSLGSRQLARRPLRYTRSALLLMLAMSMGVFALSYAATWTESQRDQAEYQVGADVRVTPNRSLSAPPTWALARAYQQLPGVDELTPVERGAIQISRSAGRADLLAMNSDTAASTIRVRADTTGTSLDAAFRRLREGRPEPPLLSLPPETTAIQVEVGVELGEVHEFQFDFAVGEFVAVPVDPADLDGARIVGGGITILDARAIVYRPVSGPTEVRDGRAELIIPFEQGSDRALAAVGQLDAGLDDPLQLAAIQVTSLLPRRMEATNATVTVRSVAAAPSADGPWAPIDLGPLGEWTITTPFGQVPDSQTSGLSLTLPEEGAFPFSVLGGLDEHGVGWRMDFTPRSIMAVADAELPILVNRAFLNAAAVGVGDVFALELAGHETQVRVTGVVNGFPTTAPGEPLVIVDGPSLSLLRLPTESRAGIPDEWWMRLAADAPSDAATAGLRGEPLSSNEVLSVADRTRSLSADPVALGVIGALTVGSVAAGLFAIVGLTVSAAVSARQRRTEFALLRALGLSGGQLSGWLWLENASLVVVSLLAGTILGLLIGWVALPYITVTQQAAAPVPSVIIHLPWDRILVLEAISVIGLTGVVVALAWFLKRIGVGSILRMGED